MRQKKIIGGIVSAAALFLLSNSAAIADSKNGLCVKDIHVLMHNRVGVYHYDSNVHNSEQGGSLNGLRLGIPVAYWDVPLGLDSNGRANDEMMGLSYKLAPFSEGKCLDGVAITLGIKAQAPIPTTNRGELWTPRAHWYTSHVTHIEVPTDRDLSPKGREQYKPDTDHGGQGVLTASLFQRTMTGGNVGHSDWIVSELKIENDLTCDSATGGDEWLCAGSWKDQGGGPRRLMVRMEPYSAFSKSKVSVYTGRWVELSNCNGCSSTNYSYAYGVTEGNAVEKSSETGESLSVTVGTEVEYEKGPVTVKGKLEVTGTMSQSRAEAITKSFEKSKQEGLSHNCDRGRLFQWRSSMTLESKAEITANSDLFVCTSNDDAPADIRDISWTGCEVEEVFSDVIAPETTNKNIRYVSTGSGWRCKKSGAEEIKVPAGSFQKNGNNGTVSCNTFCGKTKADGTPEWGDKTGACVEAKNESTGQRVSCDTVPGLIPDGRQLTCFCQSGDEKNAPNKPAADSYSFESYNYPGYYIRHQGSVGKITTITSDLDKKDATFQIVPGLAGSCKSFESINFPKHYLEHPQKANLSYRQYCRTCLGICSKNAKNRALI